VSIRSRPLLGLALFLLASAGTLGAILHHDAEVGATRSLAESQPGDEVRAKGAADPFLTPPESRLPPHIMAVLGEYTYILTDPALVGEDMLVLVTDDEPHLDSGSVVVEGEVLFRGDHPDRSGRTLLIVRASDWTTPLLFR
jgi:hypothetical protein